LEDKKERYHVIVDDEESIRQSITRNLVDESYRILTAQSGEEANLKLKKGLFKCPYQSPGRMNHWSAIEIRRSKTVLLVQLVLFVALVLIQSN